MKKTLCTILSFAAGGFSSIAILSFFMPHPTSNNTKHDLALIELALEKHLENYGFLPCPASFEAEPGHPYFGVQSRENTACISSNGIIHNESYYIGALPIDNLGLPYNSSFDSEGNRFVYIIGNRNHPEGKGDDIAIKSGQGYVNASYAVVSTDQGLKATPESLEADGNIVMGH